MDFSLSPGTYSNPGATTCTICPAGYFCSDILQFPLPCIANQFSLVGTGTTSCTACPLGYTSVPGASSCVKCPAGTYRANSNLPGAGLGCQTCTAPNSFSCPGSFSELLCSRMCPGICPNGALIFFVAYCSTWGSDMFLLVLDGRPLTTMMS